MEELLEIRKYKIIIPVDLQMFAAEDEGRTEDPTGKKKSEARGEGKVPKSQFMNQAVLLFTGFLMLYYTTGWMFNNLVYYSKYTIEKCYKIHNIDVSIFSNLLMNTGVFVIKILSPFLAAAFIMGILVNILQSGVIWSTKAMKFELKKIMPNPSKLFKQNLFSKKALVNFSRTIALLIVIFVIEYKVIHDRYDRIPLMSLMGVMESVKYAMDTAMSIFFKVLILMLIIAIFDYIFERYEYTESLKMKPEEVKDERKQSEGDPEIKKKIRQKQFEMSAARMLQEVPKADVVITNPTHYAIALKYDKIVMDAPIVLAKGKNYLALKIKQIAIDEGIHIEENRPLARALYDSTEVGDKIPEEFYKVVAGILSKIYNLKRGKQAA